MAGLLELVTALEERVKGREHFVVVATPGLEGDDQATNPIRGIAVDEAGHDVLLLYSSLQQSDQQLTVA